MKILPGGAINRQYRNFRTMRNNSWKMFFVNTTLASISAYKKDLPFTFALGALSCLWIHKIEASINAMLPLKQAYREIEKRAIHIKIATKFKH